MLKEQNKPLAEVPHRSFAKVAPSKIDIQATEVKFDKAAAEDYIRKVSAIFSEYPDAYNSNVAFSYRQGYRYLVNSEGSVNRIPDSFAKLVVGIVVRTADGEIAYDQFQYNSRTPELPPIEKTIAETRSMIEAVIASSKAPRFAEEYTGPVLFEGREVALLLQSQLFTGEDRLIATNNVPALKGMRFESTTSIETRIGKPVFAEGMTVKALPKMKKFGDEVMMGAFEVDDEGVIPADETVIVENGVLKNILNDRTLTKPGQVANGLGDGPGVVAVTFKNGIPMSDMKSKLIAQAKKDGLDYGLLVKNAANVNGGMFQYIYKVYVDDGREELVRDATIKGLSQRDFRKILETSKETAVHHHDRGPSILSMICPSAVLLEEVEFTTSDAPSFKDEDYVPSPLKK
jgi:predicted Zn-dependent protease